HGRSKASRGEKTVTWATPKQTSSFARDPARTDPSLPPRGWVLFFRADLASAPPGLLVVTPLFVLRLLHERRNAAPRPSQIFRPLRPHSLPPRSPLLLLLARTRRAA